MSKNKTYLPTKDEIFKRLFGAIGNEEITKNFINGILGMDLKRVTLDHKLELPREHPKDKQMIADVITKDEQGRRYILEMQRREYPGILKRFFGYTKDVKEKF